MSYTVQIIVSVLIGIHAVAEALRAGRTLDRLLIAKGAGGQRIQELIDLARDAGTSVRFEQRSALDRVAASAAHQGVVALGAEHRYSELADIAARGELIVLLDGVEDPHNLGAIIRTAHAAGAGCVAIPERRAAGLTETVAKTAAGALEHLPIARVTNLNRAIEELKKSGYWIYGVDERGSERHDSVRWNRPTAIVLGAEGRGLHQQVKEHCDVLVRIPMAGKISSLNVSVASGIVLFAWKTAVAEPA